MALAFIGLGSNIGDRASYISGAIRMIAALADTEIAAESTILETGAVDYTDQPDFLNRIILIKTGLSPADLLESLKNIEKSLGRIRRFAKGPREIDLDILLYDNLVITTDDLVIPHPEIINRKFVVEHLLELEPGLCDPVSGKKYSDLKLE